VLIENIGTWNWNYGLYNCSTKKKIIKKESKTDILYGNLYLYSKTKVGKKKVGI